MPVVPTPVPTPGGPQSACSALKELSPSVTAVEGTPNYAKPMAFTIQQGQQAVLEWTMRDPSGCPVDLTTCGGPVTFYLREALSLGDPSSRGVVIPCNPVDLANGVVDVSLTADAVAYPGISLGQFAASDSDGQLIFSNDCWLIVNRALSVPAGQQTHAGPPTLAEIRLHMRDSSPVDNLWLGVNEFDNVEIASCIVRPIDYFNETPPPLDFSFNTSNFPWRYNWLNGIIACLYELASLHYSRVHLPYSAGGTQVDDKNKAQEYAQVAQRKWEDFKQWVLQKKVQINAQGAYMTTGSLYDWRSWGV